MFLFALIFLILSSFLKRFFSFLIPFTCLFKSFFFAVTLFLDFSFSFTLSFHSFSHFLNLVKLWISFHLRGRLRGSLFPLAGVLFVPRSPTRLRMLCGTQLLLGCCCSFCGGQSCPSALGRKGPVRQMFSLRAHRLPLEFSLWSDFLNDLVLAKISLP